MTCFVRFNQPIYDALIEKSKSFPPIESSLRDEFVKVADRIKCTHKDLYALYYYQDLLCEMCYLCEDAPSADYFISNFLEATSCSGPRRSHRLKSKPRISYFHIHNYKAIQTDDVNSMEYEDEDEDEKDNISNAIKAVCDEKGLTFSQDLINEFYTWRSTAPKYTTVKYYQDSYVPAGNPEIAKEWAELYSTTLNEQNHITKTLQCIKAYCYKNDIQYDPTMLIKFSEWYKDPVNMKYIMYTSRCICENCFNKSFYCTPSSIVKYWFSSLQKADAF